MGNMNLDYEDMIAAEIAALKELEPGSDEHSKQLRAISEAYKNSAEMVKAEAEMEANDIKRAEVYAKREATWVDGVTKVLTTTAAVGMFVGGIVFEKGGGFFSSTSLKMLMPKILK